MNREAGGYQYLNEKFEEIHSTSVPMTDREALEYFSIVALWFTTTSPKYILKRDMNEYEYKMMPYTYDAETEEVTRIETAQESGAVPEG